MSEERYYLVIIYVSQSELSQAPRTDEELKNVRHDVDKGICSTYNAQKIERIEQTDLHIYIVTTHEENKKYEGNSDFADEIGRFLNIYVKRYGDWYLVNEISKERRGLDGFLSNFRGGYQGNKIERDEFGLGAFCNKG